MHDFVISLLIRLKGFGNVHFLLSELMNKRNQQKARNMHLVLVRMTQVTDLTMNRMFNILYIIVRTRLPNYLLNPRI